MENTPIKSNQKSCCSMFFSIISCTPQHDQDMETTKPSSGWVPIVFNDHAHIDQVHQDVIEKPRLNQERVPTKRVRIQAEKDEGERPKPSRVFSEYIERAGTKIRANSSVGTTKHTLRRDSLNTRVSEYINRAKAKFTTKPSFAEHGN